MLNMKLNMNMKVKMIIKVKMKVKKKVKKVKISKGSTHFEVRRKRCLSPI